MAITHEPLIITRYMAPEAQKYLAQRAAKAADLSPGSSVLRMLNRRQANLPLVKRQPYGKALRQPHGQLKDLATEESRGVLEENIRVAPTESKVLFGETRKTYIVSRGVMKIITYPLVLPEPEDEHERLTGLIDYLNDTGTRWGQFSTNLMVAMFHEDDDRAVQIEEGFEAARPAAVVLTRAQVMPASEMPNIN